MSRSTLTDLFHRAVGLWKPLVLRIELRSAESAHVLADETCFRVQTKGGCRRGFIRSSCIDPEAYLADVLIRLQTPSLVVLRTVANIVRLGVLTVSSLFAGLPSLPGWNGSVLKVYVATSAPMQSLLSEIDMSTVSQYSKAL